MSRASKRASLGLCVQINMGEIAPDMLATYVTKTVTETKLHGQQCRSEVIDWLI